MNENRITALSEKSTRKSQCDRIVALLRSRAPEWVPLYEILPLAAQYNARIWCARRELGLKIENKTEVIDGVRHSWFRLVEEVAR